MNNKVVLYAFIAALIYITPAYLSAQTIPKEELIFLTSEWEGERFPDGRPKISDSLIERARKLRVEEAWQILHEYGYQNQYEGGWKRIHNDIKIVGRALTAEYLPLRPDLQKNIVERGHRQGYEGRHLHWPINKLTKGDVYVANNEGREGSLMGDNLGNIIYNKSGNGVVFDGYARDLPGLLEIDGFNALVRDFGPEFLHGVLLMGMNTPISIGEAIVLPGDLVIADRTGVVFIPAHMAERVVSTVEFIGIVDKFKRAMIAEGRYGSGTLDNEWTDEIKNEFVQWLQQNPNMHQYTRKEIDEFMEIRTF